MADGVGLTESLSGFAYVAWSLEILSFFLCQEWSFISSVFDLPFSSFLLDDIFLVPHGNAIVMLILG